MAYFPFRLASVGTAALLTLLTLPLLETARGSESVDTSQRAYKLVILDSLGGNSGANGVNDRGWIAGSSYLTGNQIQHATLWTLKPNRLIDLGTQRAALWQNGVGYDLNTLIPPNSRYSLIDAIAISDSGIIAGGAYDAKTGAFVSFAAVPTGLRPDRTSLSAVRPVALPPSVIQRIRQHGLRRFL